MGVLLVGLGAFCVGAAMALLYSAAMSRKADVRSRDVKRFRRQAEYYDALMIDVEDAVDRYRDLESPLAAEIRGLVRACKVNLKQIERNG